MMRGAISWASVISIPGFLEFMGRCCSCRCLMKGSRTAGGPKFGGKLNWMIWVTLEERCSNKVRVLAFILISFEIDMQ